MIGVKNQEHLNKAIQHALNHSINVETFFEPDWDYGVTAFATQPIPVDNRHIFKKFQLWRAS